MKLVHKLFILASFSFFLSIIPQPALAQNATALVVSAPSSVEKDETFSVTAYYTSNGTNVCGATCKLEGGWLASTVYLSEGSGCVYENTGVSAYGSAGSYSPYVNCYKQYYDSKTESFSIEITQKTSSLSVSVNPSSPYPGDMITIYAYYRDGQGSMIQGASCTASLKGGGVEFQKITLVPSGNAYYSGTLKVPSQYGTYDLWVACASDKYVTKESAKSFTTSKRRASLSVSVPSSGYYGESVKVVAYYKDVNEGKMIPGTCRITFEDKTSALSQVGMGYEGMVKMPYRAGALHVKVACESSEYETLETSQSISAANRPTGIKVISPVIRDFYPTDEIQLRISYGDTLSNGDIAGAGCSAQTGGKSYPMSQSGKYYGATLSNQPIGQQTVQFRCSKTFYEEAAAGLPVTISRIPISIIFTPMKTDFRRGEEIKILAKAVDNRNNDANVSCHGRADVYDLSFNRLVNSRDVPASKTGEGFSLSIPNPGEPSKIRVTMSCAGDIFEEKSASTELKIEMLGEQTEEGMTLFLAATTVILLALTFLIRKKLKII